MRKEGAAYYLGTAGTRCYSGLTLHKNSSTEFGDNICYSYTHTCSSGFRDKGFVMVWLRKMLSIGKVISYCITEENRLQSLANL